MTAFAGSCLCGSVRFEGESDGSGGHCYCIDCRKTSGTAFGSHMVAPGEHLKVEGEVRFYDSEADSGHTVSRGFCPTCGTQIYTKNSGFPGLYFVRASALDDMNIFEPQMQVYVTNAPTWSKLDDSLPKFDGMPPFEERPSQK